MAEKDSEDKPSLELPSFGFGRKKGKPKTGEPVDGAPSAVKPDDAGTTPDRPVESTATVPTAAPPTRPRASREPATVKPDAGTASSDSTATSTAAVPPPGASPVTPSAPPSEQPVVEAKSKPARQFSFPAISALRAVLVVGAVIGLLGVLLTFASLKFCELATGTDSCGGPGLLLLVAIVVLLTYAGSWLLRRFGIAEAGSLSFLAVALLAVVVMTFFLGTIYSRWMILVIPAASMATYALSWWVTTSMMDDDTRREIRPR